jgi:hypothetical protein
VGGGVGVARIADPEIRDHGADQRVRFAAFVAEMKLVASVRTVFDMQQVVVDDRAAEVEEVAADGGATKGVVEEVNREHVPHAFEPVFLDVSFHRCGSLRTSPS